MRVWRHGRITRGPIPESDILAATTPLPWIYAAGLTAHGEGRNPISFMEHEEAELMAWMAAGAAQHPGGIPQAVLDRVPLGGTSAEALAGAEARISRAMWRYLHRKAADRPAAVSVTSLTHTQAPVVVGQDEARAPVPSVTGTLELPRLAQQLAELSATDRGTVTHLALELLDHALTTDLEAQLEELVKRETLTARELAAVDLTALRWLLNSELGPYLRGERGKVHRELPVYLPGEEGEGLDRQMIRGRIDLLVDTPEGPIVIDYKTDRVSGKKLEERVEQYGKQVAFYRRAAEALTGKPCAGVYLAFISAEPRTVWKL